MISKLFRTMRHKSNGFDSYYGGLRQDDCSTYPTHEEAKRDFREMLKTQTHI